jgi:hypothetical protein
MALLVAGSRTLPIVQSRDGNGNLATTVATHSVIPTLGRFLSSVLAVDGPSAYPKCVVALSWLLCAGRWLRAR